MPRTRSRAVLLTLLGPVESIGHSCRARLARLNLHEHHAQRNWVGSDQTAAIEAMANSHVSDWVDSNYSTGKG
eukprot:2788350-Amphidinium_carterae.1